jgi:hypothetical protein
MMKKSFYIDYPQEHLEGQAHTYRCAFCKVLTTTVNGHLEGHLADCAYRLQMEKVGYECDVDDQHVTTSTADEYD